MAAMHIEEFADAHASDLADLLTESFGTPIDAEGLLAALAGLPARDGMTADAAGLATGEGSRHLIAREAQGVTARALVWRTGLARPGDVFSDIRAADGERGREALALVLADQVSWLALVGGARLRTTVDDHERDRHDLLIGAGFREEAHVVAGERALARTSAIGVPVPAAPTVPPPHGVELDTYDRIERDGDPQCIRYVQRALHALVVATLVDNPGHVEAVPDFDDWRREVFDADAFRAEWLVLAFEADRLVGLSHAVADGDPDRAYLEYTGVARDIRGRGIAAAMKSRLDRELVADGVRILTTEWAESNAPIAHLNARAGYAIVGGHRRLVLDVLAPAS
ncbi:Acetyltransferase (GNAT) family protein [Agromyces sp. CF514]|uniref:GNAT family N-acetyltransferase n=1 Tax=Agromyces sp. CF514 TaxID=1881031 RepID=UPI0008E81118|nr:GNAT family N-acetyltransferase [Agromyces sp. CF514]SFR83178.1 Acetyltransferase (GNAT) family protein [Agromyces sp. CF514]